MKPRFQVRILKFSKLGKMPQGLSNDTFHGLLKLLDFSDPVADEELESYVVMALQDLEPEEAAQLVLGHLLSEPLSPGQIRNLSEEMKDERQWEEHPDMSCHEPIFQAQLLLSQAFSDYPAPDIARMDIEIEAASPDGEKLLKRPISEPLLVRILADGMTENAVLHRLFEDQIAKPPFPEASQILWQYDVDGDEGKKTLSIFAPRHWIGPLENVDSYTSAAFPDDED